jgi:hypothetical protein
MSNKHSSEWSSVAIERFLSRVNAALKSRSKEMRMDMDSAQELSTAIAALLGQQSAKDEEIQILQRKLIETHEALQEERKKQNTGGFTIDGSNIEADGGGFK